MAKLKAHLIVIDGQNDFCDIPDAECPIIGGIKMRPMLPVAGANADMGRIATMIRRVGPRLVDIHCTLDSHRRIGIERPAFWMDQNGHCPPPFTFISVEDVEDSVWTPRSPAYRQYALSYVKALKATNKFTLCIWPPHCEIARWGANIHATLDAALQEWSEKEFATVDYVTKGSNFLTEHYGALMAEVPDPSDPGTALNTNFLTTIADGDIIGVCGEASTHCVWNTMEQIAENIGAQHLTKFQLITDCMSPVVVPGVKFPDIREMKQKYGMALTNSLQFLA